MTPILSRLATATRWHRPLMLSAALLLGLSVFSAVALFVDPRTLLGESVWLKPMKFGFAVAVYSITMAWLLTHLRRGRRVGWWLGTVFAVCGVLDVAAVALAASHGTFSHYSESTDPISVAVSILFGIGVTPLLLTTLGIAVVLLVQRHQDPALATALRAGLVLAAASMMSAGVLSSLSGDRPRLVHDANGRDIPLMGGHGIGDPDGHGMALTNWSTTGGDLRAPHFFGMHGIQVLLLAVLVTGLLSSRFAVLRITRVRARLVGTVVLGYAGVFGVLVWQAARGQSVVHPDPLTVGVTVGWLGLCAMGALIVLTRARKGALDLSGRRRRSV